MLHRAYRVLADDSRPLRQRLTREAKRIVIAIVAAIVLILLYLLIRALT